MMKTIIAASAAIAFCAFVASHAQATTDPSVDAKTTLGTPAITKTHVQIAHGFHFDCRVGPRGYRHRNAVWSLGLPTMVFCR